MIGKDELRDKLLKKDNDAAPDTKNQEIIKHNNDQEAQTPPENQHNEGLNLEIVEPNVNILRLSDEEIDSAKTKFYSSICLIIFGVITCLIAIFGFEMVRGYNSTIEDFRYNWKLQPLSDTV